VAVAIKRMTKTPNLSFSLLSKLLPSRRQKLAALKEPFISKADGKKHTTGQLERSSMKVRWLVLVLTAFFMGCNYYCYDNPAALYKPLADSFSDLPSFDYYYSLLYSVYSIPNIVLPVLGGLLVDRAGLYFSLNLFAALILVGQVIFAAGCSYHSFPIMLFGRFVFGLGGESISVAQSALVERWFSETELALALGATLSIGRVGSVINNAVSPYIGSLKHTPHEPVCEEYTVLCQRSGQCACGQDHAGHP